MTMAFRLIILLCCLLVTSCSNYATETNARAPSLLPAQIHTLAELTTVLDTEFSASSIEIIASDNHITVILPSYYAFINPHRINKSFKPNLLKLIDILKIYQPRTIEIIGYTDNEESFSTSLATSKEWANTIMKYFVKHALPRENITVLGYGSLHPITTNYTNAGRMQNRRVEIVIYPNN
jgi:outer membrane protein OmpA-like peptidoglycan-associated protein